MSDHHDPQPGGLTYPDRDEALTTAPPPTVPRRPPKQARRPMPFWDRAKVVLLFIGIFGLVLWAVVADNPASSFQEEFAFTLQNYGWLLALAGLELMRQAHYLISEQSAAYHHFWTRSLFGGIDRRWRNSFTDWTRFRVSRAVKVAVVVVVLDLVVARLMNLHPITALVQLPLIGLQALPFILQIVLYAFILILQFAALFWFLSRGGVDTYMPEAIETRFSDVWGQDHVLEKVKESIVYLEDPESIEDRGGFVPGGILLWGPPGTGKTLMAEAVAGETGKPFVFVDPGAFTQMFLGVGILKVKALFRKLRKLALRYGGVIVFFDEADSLGSRGSAVGGGGWAPGGAAGAGMDPAASGNPFVSAGACNGMSYLSGQSMSLVMQSGYDPSAPAEPRAGIADRMVAGFGMGSGGMGTLQALLTEISGLKKPRGFINKNVRRALGMKPKPPPKYRILIMMATNMPQALDEALLRPGRLDRIYRVGYPSKAGRIRTYQGYLDKVSHALSPEQVEKLATITPYATGATIKDMVNEALINALREGREAITWRDVIRAKQLKQLGPPEDVEYIERERHAVAIHEACHAVAAYRVRKHLAIDIATIEKGSTYLGMVASIPLEEQFTQWRSEYEADIVVALAALAGERLFFDGDNTSGVRGDLASATAIAMNMEGYFAMGSSVGSHAVIKGQGSMQFVDASRNILETELGRKIETKLAELLDRTRQLLEDNRLEVLAIAHALELHKTLTGEDVAAIIEGREGPLVDGRPYHTAEFVRIAESYHSRALEAHRGHHEVDLALPVLNGQHAPRGSSSAAFGAPAGAGPDDALGGSDPSG